MPADGLGVYINELVHPFRIVRLDGLATPERGVVVPIQQRATATHYPGTNKASVQVMGTKDGPIVLRGWFRDALSTLDPGPQSYVDTIRGIMQGGSLCTLTWGTVIFRTGRIERFEPEYLLDTYIRYTIEFTVDQPPEAIASKPTVVVNTAAAIREALSAAAAQAAKVLAVASAAKTIAGVVR